jgi:parallel beta-helix repeat protein
MNFGNSFKISGNEDQKASAESTGPLVTTTIFPFLGKKMTARSVSLTAVVRTLSWAEDEQPSKSEGIRTTGITTHARTSPTRHSRYPDCSSRLHLHLVWAGSHDEGSIAMRRNTVRQWLRQFAKGRSTWPEREALRRFIPMVEPLEDRLAPTVYTVTSNTDDGSGQDGTLSGGIDFGNANPGTTIEFSLTGSQIINVTGPEPAITGSSTLILGGQFTPGVLLQGPGAEGFQGDGLTIDGTADGIQCMAIDNFNGSGIAVNGTQGTIEACYIGTDLTGETAVGDVGDGIVVTGSNNIIGGPFNPYGDEMWGDLISGNGGNGIDLVPGASCNIIEGDIIGSDLAGMMSLGSQQDGILINSSNANTIGYWWQGNDYSFGNVIAGDAKNGIEISNSQGDYVIVSQIGSTAVANGRSGIVLENGSSGNLIGSPSEVGSGDIITGNGEDGVQIISGSFNNVVSGDSIGREENGDSGSTNGLNGVMLDDTAYSNTIGGTDQTLGNTITGNGVDGVLLNDVVSANPNNTQNLIENNTIDNNQQNGVENQGVIGTSVLDNDISGNTQNGVLVGNGSLATDGLATDTLIAGDQIGADTNGNGADGILIQTGWNTVGAEAQGGGDPKPTIITGNFNNLVLSKSKGNANNNLVINSTISDGKQDGISIQNGTDNTIGGTDARTSNTITNNAGNGITIAGSTKTMVNGNVITSNNNGIKLLTQKGIASTSNSITNNNIASNRTYGIAITSGSNNTIGGTSDEGKGRNTIIGNGSDAIRLDTSNAITITGNYIGIQEDPTNDAGLLSPNQGNGITLVGSNRNVIGGAQKNLGNVISGNSKDGIYLASSSENTILNNLVGTDLTGTVGLDSKGTITGNLFNGIEVGAGSNTNRIGRAGAPNVVCLSGSYDNRQTIGKPPVVKGGTGVGILIANIADDKANPTGNIIDSNLVGEGLPLANTAPEPLTNLADGIRVKFAPNTDILNNTVLRNPGEKGVNIIDSPGFKSVGNTIKDLKTDDMSAAATVPGMSIVDSSEGIVISNVVDGLEISGSSNVVVQGNSIGVDTSGASLGDSVDGILIDNNSSNNLIGGATSGAGNVIALNGGAGVRVLSGTGNHISDNTIYGNQGLGIDLGPSGVTLNSQDESNDGTSNWQSFPVISSVLLNGGSVTVTGTVTSSPNSTCTVEFFDNTQTDPSGYGQGQLYLGVTTVTTDSNGDANFVATFNVPSNGVGSDITATATDSNGNTSEFSHSAQGYNPGTIAGGVSNDFNTNGILDPYEAGLSGVTVNLLNASDGTLVATTTTDAAGAYEFDNQAAGSYYVQYLAPSGYQFSPQNAGSDSTTNSLADPASGDTPTFTLTDGGIVTDQNAGLSEPDRSIPGLTLTTDNNPSVYGQAVTLTATVSGSSGTPTGTVTFFDGSTLLGTSVLDQTGTATLSVSSFGIGSHTLSAVYNGDANDEPATSAAYSQQVNQDATTVALASSASPSSLGDAVSFTATVTGADPGSGLLTGVVTFYDGTTVLGASNLDGTGTATLSTTSLALGSHTITASYSGDINFVASTATLTQQVNEPGSITLSDSCGPVVLGQPITLTAAVAGSSGMPTGTVSFIADGTIDLGDVSLDGTGAATLSIPLFDAGDYSIVAVYNGDTTYGFSSSNPVFQEVDQAATTTTLATSSSSAQSGQPVTFTATIGVNSPGIGMPTGTVTFMDGSNVLGTATLDLTGTAVFTTSGLAVGSHPIAAIYSGDSDFIQSSDSLTEEIS